MQININYLYSIYIYIKFNASCKYVVVPRDGLCHKHNQRACKWLLNVPWGICIALNNRMHNIFGIRE